MGGQRGSRWLFVGLGLLACLGFAALEAHRVRAMLDRSAGQLLTRSFEPGLSLDGGVEVHLLPRPRVVVRGAQLADTGLWTAEIPKLEATASVGSLLSGRLAFSRLRLIAPRIAVDVDALVRAGSDVPVALLAGKGIGSVAIEAGTLTLRSRHAALRGPMTGVDATVYGLDHAGAAIVTGHAIWREAPLDLAIRVDPFLDFALGREATGSVTLRSRVLDAAVQGAMHAGVRGGFEGTVAASTPSLAGLLREADLPAGLAPLAERVSFSGSGVANTGTVTFSNARVAFDDTAFEGSLAWQPNRSRWAWTGTFATDTLDLTRGLAALPALRDRSGRWNDTPWAIDPRLLGDVDLRVSAAHALLGPLTIEDAAFSALCRDGRIEAGFSEARSLDGLVRGRAVAAIAGQDIDLRVDLSLSQLDLEPLAQLIGTAGVSGLASGHFVATAHGSNPRALVESLGGGGQIGVRGGSLPALPSVADLSALGLDAPAWLRSRTALPFDLATADLRLKGNRIEVADGRVIGPDRQQSFSAEASLSDNSFSMLAVPTLRSGLPAAALTGILGTPPRILQAEARAAPTAPAQGATP